MSHRIYNITDATIISSPTKKKKTTRKKNTSPIKKNRTLPYTPAKFIPRRNMTPEFKNISGGRVRNYNKSGKTRQWVSVSK